MRTAILQLTQSKMLRYFFTAGTATLADILIYHFMMHYVLKGNMIPTRMLVISASSLSLIVSYTSGLIINFSLTKLIVFNESEMKTRHQFSRFVMVAIIVLAANYAALKLFVEVLMWNPTGSRAATALGIGLMSYVFHKKFTFKIGSDSKPRE